jgi:hypothetical protein
MPLKMYDLNVKQKFEDGDSGKVLGYWSKGLHDSVVFTDEIKEKFNVEIPSNQVVYSYGKKVPDFSGFMWIEISGKFRGMKGAFPVTHIEIGG